MKTRHIILYISLLSTITAANVWSAEITWKLYLKSSMTQGPVLEYTAPEGREFVIENVNLTGSQSQSSELMDDLDGTTFVVQQLPVNQSVEIRIILNINGNEFEKAGSFSTFFNGTVELYTNGRREDSFSFSPGSPLIMTIPKGSGLDNLLEKCDCTRSDNILFVYFDGRDFEKEGVDTQNQISGLKANINRTDTIVGGLGDDFGFPRDFQYRPWHKIKELFK